MSKSNKQLLSIVIPLYNEGNGLAIFHTSLLNELTAEDKYDFEIIYINDGSTDETAKTAKTLEPKNFKLKFINFSRNFGKENALTAGIANSVGEAVIMLDGDGQHPLVYLPVFIRKWETGAQVVVGIRSSKLDHGLIKKISSWMFYKLFNLLTDQKLIIGSTDYRLIDKVVRAEFNKLSENNRITRALIDWLGFRKEYIYFKPNEREFDQPGYSTQKLFKLAIDSFVSITTRPLYVFAYVGIFITTISFVLGIAVIVEQLILGDPWNWNFTGTAMLGIMITFLVGLVLISQGILSLYLSFINNQTKNRPLYIIDYESSLGIKE